MATKRFNEQTFSAEVNGITYTFECYTTKTRNGFCHTAICKNPFGEWIGKNPYSFRPWEEFRYATALSNAIRKCTSDKVRASLHKILIEERAEYERKQAEQFTQAFADLHSSLSDNAKRILTKAPAMETQEDAERMMGVMAMMKVMGM